jgi:uncharacterized protein YegL
LNHRDQYQDVIILITDGEPFGVTNAREKAIAEAQKLKDRGVLIIGLGVGTVNMATLRDISSPNQAVMATFDNIHTKLEELVALSCGRVSPGIGTISNALSSCLCWRTLYCYNSYQYYI